MIEGIGTIEPSEAFKINFARPSHFWQVIGGLSQWTEDDLDILVIATRPDYSLIHFLPPDVSPERNSTTSPSAMM